ncbi:MAG: ECF transporter S component [Clostridia bacterium]|nr:ECF transporter S component [Clostridia bacterium]
MSAKHLYRMVFTALMAAIVFVTTMFLKIEIPTPAGLTMLKVANVFCLFGGMLLGPVYGGLAAGIGSMLFDLSNPSYAASAPFTLVFFFMMGFVCGLISHAGGKRGLDVKQNAIGAVAGSAAYFVLNIGKSIILLVMAGSALWPAIIANSTKMITSGVNAGIAIVFSTILAKPLMAALDKNGLLSRLDG